MFRLIANLFYSDQEFALHALPKLTLDHIVLTSYSKMKVCICYFILGSSEKNESPPLFFLILSL